MKNISKSLTAAVLTGVIYLSLSLGANAQHHSTNGGSGGGGGNSTQSSPPPSRPSAPSNNGGGVRTAPAPRSNNSGGYVQRNNYNRQPSSVQRSNGITQRTTGITQRNYAGHVGVTPGTRTSGINARSYQGSVYGHNRAGFSVGVGVGVNARSRSYYHYNHGYYGSYYSPRLGFSIGVLPYGYYPFYFDDYQYFYSGGLFYQYQNDQYTVVEPPVGAEVTTLPSNAQSIVINGSQYYEVNGVYYQPITKDDGTLSYQVAGKDGELNTDGGDGSVDNAPPAPQIGDMVTQLPPDCRKININGEKLYLSADGVYYKAQTDQSGNKVYKIVGLPADDDQNQPDQTTN